MTIIEQVARYLAREGIGAFGGTADGSVFFGSMPSAPKQAICVLGTDMRTASDTDGARVQVVVRGGALQSWTLQKAADIVDALDGAQDVEFVFGENYIVRCTLENGPAYIGRTEDGAGDLYSMNFRVYYC